jgi:hypothetical protein
MHGVALNLAWFRGIEIEELNAFSLSLYIKLTYFKFFIINILKRQLGELIGLRVPAL